MPSAEPLFVGAGAEFRLPSGAQPAHTMPGPHGMPLFRSPARTLQEPIFATVAAGRGEFGVDIGVPPAILGTDKYLRQW
jgi:hypothetical protein